MKFHDKQIKTNMSYIEAMREIKVKGYGFISRSDSNSVIFINQNDEICVLLPKGDIINDVNIHNKHALDYCVVCLNEEGYKLVAEYENGLVGVC